MRQIKFRAWDNIKKEWLSNKQIWRMRMEEDGKGSILPPPIYWHQDPHGVTYCQFTGLLDQNGVEIYEGDVLTIYNQMFREYHWGVVIWRDDLFGFYVNMKDYYVPLSELGEQFKRDWDRIGNSYENPELIKL